MSAHIRHNVWHLHLVDVIVPADHVVESVLPVHCHKWHSIIIVKKESTVAINNFFHFRNIPVLDDCSKHLCHVLCNQHYPCSSICLCGFDNLQHIRCSLQLMVDIHCPFLKVNVFLCQPTEFCFCQVKSKK